MPTTPPPVLHEFAFRRLRVEAIERLSAHMTRVRLGGNDLDGLVTMGPTDHVKLAVPGPEFPVIDMPEMVNGRVTFPGGRRPPLRDYTIRRHHPERNEVDIDIATHGHGHVSNWASRAAVGDLVGMGGPRGSHPMPVAAHYVLVGDLSSLPAIARWVEELPASTTAQVLLAAQGKEDRVEISSPASVMVRWLHEPEGVPADQLAPSLDHLDLSRPDVYVWAGGEVLAMRAVRDRLREEFRLPDDSYNVDGYWRRGESNYDHHRSLDD